jgi:hypothetical protein
MDRYYEGLLVGIAIGVIAILFIIPVLQQLESVIVNLLEVINGYTTRNVTERNAEIAYIQSSVEEALQEHNTQCIGFEMPSSEYIYGDECKDSCNCNSQITNSVNVGFH